MHAKTNIGATERRVSCVAGAAIALYGARRGGPGGLALATAGGLLAARAITGHCPVYAKAGIDRSGSSTKDALGGRRGLHVVEQITIARPVEEVYRFWRDLSNLPRFMRHVESVTTAGRRSHWKVRGPLGKTIEWDAEINNEVENKVIGWRTLDDATVAHAGSVNFDETSAGTTVRVKLQYEPPGGRLAGAVAKLLGEDPAGQIRDDLRRVQELLETGSVSPSQPGPLGAHPLVTEG